MNFDNMAIRTDSDPKGTWIGRCQRWTKVGGLDVANEHTIRTANME